MTLQHTDDLTLFQIQGSINLRDLGGVRSADGRRVRTGKLLRSGSLHNLTSADISLLENLPLKQIIDYRDSDEAQRHPDKYSAQMNYLNAPANPPESHVHAKVTEFSPSLLNELNGEKFMLNLYRQLPFKNSAYQQLSHMLRSPREGALLQHCAVGKDRTGVGCALTLFALGCDMPTVMEEYLLTNGRLNNIEDEIVNTFGDGLTREGRKCLTDILSTKESYLATAISAIIDRYGSVDTWLEVEYQLTAHARALLQERLLEE